MSDEKSDAEILENLGRMAKWNVAQEELRRLAHGDMMRFRVQFLEWLGRHWDLMPQAEQRAKMAEEIHMLRNQLAAARLQIFKSREGNSDA